MLQRCVHQNPAESCSFPKPLHLKVLHVLPVVDKVVRPVVRLRDGDEISGEIDADPHDARGSTRNGG